MATYISGAKAYGSPSCFKPGGLDPLAQSFFVDTPLVLTKVDLFFYSKDNAIPVKLQIRRMVNGFPGPAIIPMSEKIVYPSSISISDDGSTATSISFPEPVYLDIGEYALVLLTDSLNYRVWISEIGQEDILTDSVISEQPYIGVLFKSQKNHQVFTQWFSMLEENEQSPPSVPPQGGKIINLIKFPLGLLSRKSCVLDSPTFLSLSPRNQLILFRQ